MLPCDGRYDVGCGAAFRDGRTVLGRGAAIFLRGFCGYCLLWWSPRALLAIQPLGFFCMLVVFFFPCRAVGGIPNGFYGLPRNVAVEKALLGFVGFMARAGRVPEEFLDSIRARLSACFATASPTMREDLGGDPREVDFVEVIELEERIRNWTEIKFSAASSCRGFGANHVFVLDGVSCEIDLFSAQLLATMKSILSKFDVRMLVQFTKSMQDDDVRGVGCGVGPLVLAGEGRPPVPSGVGRSFRLGNGKVILLSEFALLSMQERHAAARRPVAGSCYQCGSRLLNIFECERCIVAEAAFSSVSGGVASGLRGPCDEDELLAAELERQYEDLDNNSSRSGAPGSSVWGAHGSVVVALSRDDVESSSASRAGPLSRCADPPGGSEVDGPEYDARCSREDIEGSSFIAVSPPRDNSNIAVVAGAVGLPSESVPRSSSSFVGPLARCAGQEAGTATVAPQ